MEASLKLQKEAFVTGHGGSTPWEILLVCLSAPVGVWLFQFLKSDKKWWNVAVEAVVLLFPMALCQTNLLYPWGITLMCLEVLLAAIFSFRQRHAHTSTAPPTTLAPTRLDFVTCYRSIVSYLTFVAILAVDFHVFPRRFAKTEVFGYGLMDLGAGSFVTAAGLTSPRARGSPSKQFRIWKILPLVGMGAIRLITNKGLEYQEHVSEYGVHWNFFFTLAALAPLGTLIPLRKDAPVAILFIYQWLLSGYGLQQYVEDAPRICGKSIWLCDLFAANREGILGCVGYLALYFLSEEVGRDCLWTGHNREKGKRLLVRVIALWFIHWILSRVLHIEASRRTTNATFVVWTLAHNTLLLFLVWAAVSFGHAVPPIFHAVNRNGLLVFVVANLLTGAVNLSMNTLEAGDGVALLVVFGYLCTVGGFALVADNLTAKIRRRKID